jgi:hypothetical protein
VQHGTLILHHLQQLALLQLNPIFPAPSFGCDLYAIWQFASGPGLYWWCHGRLASKLRGKERGIERGSVVRYPDLKLGEAGMAAEALGGKLLGEVEVGSLEEVSDVFGLLFRVLFLA